MKWGERLHALQTHVFNVQQQQQQQLPPQGSRWWRSGIQAQKCWESLEGWGAWEAGHSWAVEIGEKHAAHTNGCEAHSVVYGSQPEGQRTEGMHSYWILRLQAWCSIRKEPEDSWWEGPAQQSRGWASVTPLFFLSCLLAPRANELGA